MREGVCQTIRGSLQVINNMVVDKFTYEKLLT